MRKEQIGSATLYLGDCLEILPTLGEAADVVITDPPYGLGEKWSGGTWASNEIYQDAFEWDAKVITPELLKLVVGSGHRAIVWGGNYYLVEPSRCWLVWQKAQIMNTMADFEMAWTNLDKPAKMFIETRNPDGKREHPTQKPVSLMLWCLSQVPDAKIIIDPFMGSGTTGVACAKRGVEFVGIEKSPKYFDIACRRIKEANDQLDFFTTPGGAA